MKKRNMDAEKERGLRAITLFPAFLHLTAYLSSQVAVKSKDWEFRRADYTLTFYNSY